MNVIEASNIIEKSMFDIKLILNEVVDTVAQPFLKVDTVTTIEVKQFKECKHVHTFTFNRLLHLEDAFMKAIINNTVTKEFDKDVVTMLKDCATDVTTVGGCLQNINENTVLLVNSNYTDKVNNLVLQQVRKIVVTDLVDTMIAFDGSCLFVSTKDRLNYNKEYCETIEYVDEFITARNYIVGTIDSHHVYKLVVTE